MERAPLLPLLGLSLGCASVVVGVGCEDGADESLATGGATWSTGAGAMSGAGGGAGEGGAVATGGDLGWPFGDDVPEPCEPNPPDSGGSAWTGWGNVQHPASTTAIVGQPSEPLFGRVFRDGETPASGQAPGWEAELAIGPYGSLPTGQGRCWSYLPAAFNVDVGNDDEYVATWSPSSAGLTGFFFRYRPLGGAWRYGDLNGSEDGLSPFEAGLVVAVGAAGDEPVVMATLNLRCRLDDWSARLPLVVRALSRIDPDLVALEEDCVDGGGPTQAAEVGALLAAFTGRGYQLERVGTHTATPQGQSFEEGIAVLSAHPIDGSHSLDLPSENFPRKALAVDVSIRGRPLRFYGTHFDYGAESEAARTQSVQAILADLPLDRPSFVGGDLNATPDSEAVTLLAAAMTDLWHRANPSGPGLTMPAPDPTRRIDYRFASPSLASTVLGARLLDDHDGTTWLSDHRGVAAVLSW